MNDNAVRDSFFGQSDFRFFFEGMPVFGGDSRVKRAWASRRSPRAVKWLVRRPIPLKRRAVARCASITVATDLIEVSKGELMNTQIPSDEEERETAKDTGFLT
jgi:hypothetical protein